MSKIKILLTDDHTLFRQGIRTLLASETDMEVVGEAGNGMDAVAMAHELRPDVVLMDIGMPGMSGYDVARRIREQPRYDHIKLVALTGWGQEKDRLLSRESGFDHHLTKPVDFKVLKGLITSL